MDEDGLVVVRLDGWFRRSELGVGRALVGRQIDAGAEPRLLVVLSPSFEGWSPGEDWSDLSFQLGRGNAIARIAIVGDRKWHEPAREFTGAGFRRAPVECFDADEEAVARAWLLV
jgi:hypothetical protein